MKNGKQPIMPSTWTRVGSGKDYYVPNLTGKRTGHEVEFGGLTKREYLASKAMQGLLSNPSQIDTTNFEWVARHAVGYADALLEELSKNQ